MTTRPLILYHGSCQDGFCAAWVAHRYYGNEADYLPVNYNEDPPEVIDREVFILDFSYKRDVLLQMTKKARSIVVLDHHKTAAAELSGAIQHHDWYDEKTGHHSIRCFFDMEKSGGRLTWEYFFPKEQSPWMVDVTEDRDLWRWKIPHSKEISAWLASSKWSFDAWDLLYPSPGNKLLDDIVGEGAAILRYQQQQVDSQVKNAVEIELDGHDVLCVNATHLISEIAGKLAEGRPFGATFFIKGDGKKVWSLRSGKEGVDVSEIAKRHGGGGHLNAAGFTE